MAMIDLDKVNALQNDIPFLKARTEKENFLHQFAEVTAEALNVYFVGIYFVDELRQNIVFVAGNGIIEDELLKHHHKVQIAKDNPYMLQIGTAAYYQEIRLIDWLGNKILSYKILGKNMSEVKSETISDKRFGSPLLVESCTELQLPICKQDKTIGIIEFVFNVKSNFDTKEITKLKLLVDELAKVI